VDKDFSRELLPELGMFLFCGEELHRTTAHELRRRFPKARIVNTYGPTESTVAVTYVELSDEELSGGEGALPVGVRSGMASLRQIDGSIEEAATNLGAGTAKVFTSVTLPLIRPAFFTGLVFSFIKSMSKTNFKTS